MNLFKEEGWWFKGNIHAHTTNSDGWFSPESLVRSFHASGYNFLAITDHWKLTSLNFKNSDDFILLPGTELNGGATAAGDFHIVGLGIKKKIEMLRQSADMYSAQDLIDMVHEAEGMAILAHPSWNSVTSADILPLEGLLGLEIYNSGCDAEIARGYGDIQYDEVLARNKKMFCVAVDDCHRIYYDAFKGWIFVKAKQLTEKAILSAIKKGNFYSSQGPVIHDIDISKSFIKIVSSPAKRVNIIANPRYGHSEIAREGEFFTEVKIHLREEVRYFRVEVVDSVGRKAWTNPYYI